LEDETYAICKADMLIRGQNPANIANGDTLAMDMRDGLTGVVGTEINFNREFYVYKPPRSRSEILGEIEAMEKRFMDMLHGVKG
jgi:type I restriction-modification system DNA methylase subunit